MKEMGKQSNQINLLPYHGSSPLSIGILPSSPIGPMWVAISEIGLVMVDWNMPQIEFEHQVVQRLHRTIVYDEKRTAVAVDQLDEYLCGNLHQFSLPLDLSNLTPFQQRVLHLTYQIPYGQTCTYKEIAIQVGKPNAARAVGRVEATNPIPIVIPCHRVLGSDGSLHGYGGPGGIKLKAWLLQLEQPRL
jgi:methylated-DNA-[protein]-cysteine S-methyltransferase